jgi:peptidyl-tRNA hydrolase, PTH1 family
MEIIVGLGNPGAKYEKTRHNAGFLLLDALAEKKGFSWEKDKRSQSMIAGDSGILLIKPETYMNNSGQAVQSVLSYYKLLPKLLGFFPRSNSDLSGILTVAHDDVDIELGNYKISIGSGSAGHRGVDSIIRHLKTKALKRIRLGVKTEKKGLIPTERFVLQKFPDEEFGILNQAINRIIELEY